MEDVIELLKSIEAKPVVIESLCGVKLTNCIRVEQASALNRPECKQAMMLGLFSICDVASQAVVLRALSQIVQPTNMLEVCAGKGNKTLMFQSLANQI